MSKSRTKNSMMNIITSVGGQLLMIVLRFITRTYFIRTLGRAYLGINGLFSDILTMLSLTELGLDTAMNFKLYKPLAAGDKKRVRILMKFYRDAYRVVSVVILVLGLSLIPFLPRLIKEYDSLALLGINAVLIYVLYLARSVLSYQFFASMAAVVRADQKGYILNVAEYVITLLTNVAQIIVLVVWKDFVLYTVTLLVFSAVQNCMFALIAKKKYAYAFEKEDEYISKEEIIDTLKDLGSLFIYKVNVVVIKATDNMVLSRYIGLGIVGLYSNYLILYANIKDLLARIYTAVKASSGNLFITNDMEKKYKFFQTMNFISMILYGTACVGIAIVADEFIYAWVGTKYLIAQPFAILMGIEILFVGIKNNLGQIRQVSGIFRQMWYRPLIGIIINLTVSIVMVNKLGIYGVLIGTISADFFANFLVDPSVIHKYSFENYKPVSEYYKINFTYFAVLLAIGCLDGFICAHLFTGLGFLTVLIHTAIIGITVPATFCLVFHNRHEFKYLVNMAEPLVRKYLGKLKNRLENN